jgi:hypothetical protein
MTLWFRPVCDELYHTVARWYTTYETGEVESHRKWLNLDGVIVDRPTRYAHRIAFKPIEVQHLATIMTALAPASDVTKEVLKLQTGLRRGRLLPGGKYVVTIAWWKQDLREILEVLLQAQRGATTTLEQTLEKQKQAGKDLFEV